MGGQTRRNKTLNIFSHFQRKIRVRARVRARVRVKVRVRVRVKEGR